ncbi:hypothetical protein Salat_0246000 [Sesamum alatum]|uniref:Uncharacterized protein n=1 Tax=Sesamum alatum TaxID=300844 RepID=A0AAE2CYC0_9LAMI|nr:hypothetical protein Salat_0246000 [Sesamum alatum]
MDKEDWAACNPIIPNPSKDPVPHNPPQALDDPSTFDPNNLTVTVNPSSGEKVPINLGDSSQSSPAQTSKLLPVLRGRDCVRKDEQRVLGNWGREGGRRGGTVSSISSPDSSQSEGLQGIQLVAVPIIYARGRQVGRGGRGRGRRGNNGLQGRGTLKWKMGPTREQGAVKRLMTDKGTFYFDSNSVSGFETDGGPSFPHSMLGTLAKQKSAKDGWDSLGAAKSGARSDAPSGAVSAG